MPALPLAISVAVVLRSPVARPKTVGRFTFFLFCSLLGEELEDASLAGGGRFFELDASVCAGDDDSRCQSIGSLDQPDGQSLNAISHRLPSYSSDP